MSSQEKLQRVLCQAAALLLLLTAAHSMCAQSVPETVGRIEGADVSVKGQVSLVREGDRSVTVLLSGSEVTVRSGSARIQLAEGGEIDVCGPAQFTLLKSGGSLTLALDSGRVHSRLASGIALTVYMAHVVATPLSVAGGPRDGVVGLEADGSVCALPYRGAVRLEQQLTGQSIVAPESSEVLLPGGQLESLREGRGACRCDAERTQEAVVSSPKVTQAGALPAASAPNGGEKKPSSEPAREVPTWKVIMPPLTFDANAPSAGVEPRPEMILLVREARVTPAVVFTGSVEPRKKKQKSPKPQKTPKQKTVITAAPEAAPVAPPGAAVPVAEQKADEAAVAQIRTAPPTAEAAAKAEQPKEKPTGFGTKVKNFFRRLFGGKPKT